MVLTSGESVQISKQRRLEIISELGVVDRGYNYLEMNSDKLFELKNLEKEGVLERLFGNNGTEGINVYSLTDNGRKIYNGLIENIQKEY